MPAKGAYLAIAGGGAILLWSGLRGKSWTAVIRDLIAGKDPKQSLAANQIATASSPSSSTSLAPASSGPGQTGGYVPLGAGANPGPGEQSWISTFLTAIGAPVTDANVKSVSAWIGHEGPFGTQGQNNPLNTTLSAPGATSFAGLAVRNYPTALEGMAATVDTILSSTYSDVVAALRSGNGLCGKSFNGLSTWSGGGYSQVC